MDKKITSKEYKEGIGKMKAIQRSNPLRRVQSKCRHGWVRDPQAKIGDWLWCSTCDDLSRVIEVVE